MENADKNYMLMIGSELKLWLNEKEMTQTELAEKICEKFHTKSNGMPRNTKTTMDHISKIVKGKGLHLDTFNKAMIVLEVKRITFS